MEFNRQSRKLINVKASRYSQSVIIPSATYSPWNGNNKFQKIYKKIKNFTTLDIMRLYELWHLDDQIQHLEGNYSEIGVYKGGSSALVAKKNPKNLFFLCDTFQWVVGGIVALDYYGFIETESVAEFVNEIKHLNNLFFHNLNGHGVIIKTK